jgi:tetratricopeptide (TPR) repeat protein
MPRRPIAKVPFEVRIGLCRRYNRAILNRLFRICVPLVLLFSMMPARAQTRAASSSATIVVLPFENRSGAPGLQWIGESFPEVLSERMSMPWLYTVPRSDRAYAFERVGVPTNVSLSRATLFRIAEQMDVDYAVLGSFTFDGETFAATAQLLDVKHLRLLPAQLESGALVAILQIQGSLSWDLLRQLRPSFEVPKDKFLSQAPAIRLDAFENYIRGVLASTHEQKVQYFAEAVRRNPSYSRAMLELGKTYLDAEDYEQAADWFARVPATDERAREANFLLGLAAYHLGQNDRAQRAFRFVESQFPLPEIYNNLGVVEYAAGDAVAASDFRKAMEADPQDPDYHFNLALALSRASDSAGAARQLREVLRLRPSDAEARTLLPNAGDTANPAVPPASRAQNAAAGSKLPAPRIKSNYDETSFEQLALEIQNTIELRLAHTDPKTHAAYHVDRGRGMLQQGFQAQAEREFREACDLDPESLAAHSGLARALEKSNPEEARKQAEAALRVGVSVEALLVLGRLDLEENKPEAAAQDVQRALEIAPQDAAALDLQRLIQQKLGERGSVQ